MDAFNADNWLSLAAIVMSLIAMAYSHLTWKRSHAMERRMVEIEEGRDKAAERESLKAAVWVRMDRPARSVNRITVENDGPGIARNVRLFLDGVPAVEHSIADAGDDPIAPTIGDLDPRSVFKYSFYPTLNVTIPQVARVEWEDDSGETGSHTSQL